MSDSLDRFIKLLLRSGLITESQLSEIRSQLTPNDSSSFHKDLADKLADSGHLTAFQADELRQGHIEDLVVGDYIILEFLDKGGMGQIFKARHALMKREVAIKFTLPDADGTVSQIAIDRFQREVEAASKLTHPNIVTSLDAGQRGARRVRIHRGQSVEVERPAVHCVCNRAQRSHLRGRQPAGAQVLVACGEQRGRVNVGEARFQAAMNGRGARGRHLLRDDDPGEAGQAGGAFAHRRRSCDRQHSLHGFGIVLAQRLDRRVQMRFAQNDGDARRRSALKL